jgi:hypothetical protein
MSMAKRVGITLTQAQIELACEAFVAARLLPDEQATASLHINGIGNPQLVTCAIEVSKKRKPRERKKNGEQP